MVGVMPERAKGRRGGARGPGAMRSWEARKPSVAREGSVGIRASRVGAGSCALVNNGGYDVAANDIIPSSDESSP